MKTKIALFVGPSTPTIDSSLLDKFTIFEPIKAGDIYKIMNCGFTQIGIIDGVFHGVPSIWHREILYAIENNIKVYGSSSMGALRAAEMETFGLIGVGQVFDWYKSGLIDGDDEVALSHLPHHPFQPTTIPLVDLRFVLLNYIGLELNNSTHINIIKLCSKIQYWNRTIRALSQQFSESDIEVSVGKHIIDLLRNTESVKKNDAQLLIKQMALDSVTSNKADQFHNFGMPSLKLDIYSDFAIASRLPKESDKPIHDLDFTQNSNLLRSAYTHSLLSYWIEENDPYLQHGTAIDLTKNYFKSNQDIPDKLINSNTLFNEISHFVYLSMYFYLILDHNLIQIGKAELKAAQLYLSDNPLLDDVCPTFWKFVSFDIYPIENIIASEMFLVSRVFNEYQLDIDHLTDIYLSMFSNSAICDLDLVLQAYVFAGTFGTGMLGCSHVQQMTHLMKYGSIQKITPEL